MEISDGVRTEIVGGYNPLGWNSTTYFNYSPTDDSRTAFIFNLTAVIFPDQKLNAEEMWSEEEFQTLNRTDIIPSFGGGADLWVPQNLNFGYSWQYSFGDKIFSVYNYYGSELTTISTAPCAAYCPRFQVGWLKVFIIAAANAAPVPEPSSFGLLICGFMSLTGVGFLR